MVAAKQGFLMYYTKGVQSGPRSVSAIGRVVAYQGWSLRGVPCSWIHKETKM